MLHSTKIMYPMIQFGLLLFVWAFGLIRAQNKFADYKTYSVQVEALTERVEYGAPYEAQCILDPIPPYRVSYRWFLRNKVISEDDRLSLDALNKNTAGHYFCQAQVYLPERGNYPLKINGSHPIRLRATVSQHTEMEPPPGSRLITFIGEHRELHCEITRKGEISWFFNGSALHQNSLVNSTGNMKIVDFLRVSILTLDGVLPEQEGLYECISDSQTKSVHVIVLTEFDVEVNPPFETVEEGDAVEIHCSVQGGAKIENTQLVWFFRPRGSDQRYPLQMEEAAGFIRTDDPRALRTSVISKAQVSLSDDGDYICREPRGEEGISVLNVRRTKSARLIISPAIVRVRPGQDVAVECTPAGLDDSYTGPMAKLRIKDDGLIWSVESVGDYGSRVKVQRIESKFNGTIIECYSDDPSVAVVTSTIYVEGVCSAGFRRCRNNECLAIGRFCDGKYDCSDQSDEDPVFCNECDPIVKVCENFGGNKPEKKTYMIHWQCDGEDDCGNGFDEASCDDISLSKCGGNNFQCPASQKNIPKAYVCDQDADCPDGEDEESCLEPLVLDEPQEQYTVKRGGRVELRCEVSGSPAPRVIWRFNWGCLPQDSKRFMVRSIVENCGQAGQKVMSTLTISDFQPGDDGIYNCEGLRSMQRAMSQDYLVVIRDY